MFIQNIGELLMVHHIVKYCSVILLITLVGCASTIERTSKNSSTVVAENNSDVKLTIQSIPSSYQAFSGSFSKYLSVFGVGIVATDQCDDDKVIHAATIMFEYLDNNEDGTPDNRVVVDKLVEKKSVLVIGHTQEFFEDFDYDTIEFAGFTNIQDLYNTEIVLPGTETEQFDATLEEVFHLITHVGYAHVYPDIFGEKRGSSIANAMDVARGGYFETIPTGGPKQGYPSNSWYHYTDDTADYATQITEYFYWAMTSYLGVQANRFEDIKNEWELNTKEKLQTGDFAIYNLITNGTYHLPTVLPNGSYLVQE
ncbi:hypothetical protein DID75_03455 [Candidatus Marinamargulisbacteria bacterium SCGC AG-410-N11]|nr:hypothetical protein DID75_03455 [Candidatus Marinamargulisbacteria bacterium SCGC AG-410-N11]